MNVIVFEIPNNDANSIVLINKQLLNRQTKSFAIH